MGKRKFPVEETSQSDTEAKKAKSNGYAPPTQSNTPAIHDERSLQKLLTFHQDDIVQYRLNIHEFRRYLETSTTGKEGSVEDNILLGYLKNSLTKTSADYVEALPEIMQAWRYAVQVHDEGLMPAIPGMLSVLLQTISSSLSFVDTGVEICKTIVRKENIQLLQKSMNSSRTRDTTIARCLDLLTQIVGFDGGASAKHVWLQRSTTLSRLHQFMAMSKKTIYSASASTSVRDHAIKFFLANLRYQDQEAKAEILSNRKIAPTLLREITGEPTSIISNVLIVLKHHVVEDQNLGKSAKGHLLTDGNLALILGIMRQTEDSPDSNSIRDLAEAFLVESCTSRTNSIIFKQYGWYPPGTEELTAEGDIDSGDDTGLTNEADKYRDRVPVRNTTLAAFIQDLKPWASIPERNLILEIFKAAPELVADYFIRKKTFSFEPKLTATWIGWANFIYSVLRIPIPSHDMYLDGKARCPPPAAVILQSILPQSLSNQSLTKALKQQSELIKLFTLRILIASLGKLHDLLNRFHATASPSSWRAIANKLVNEVQAKLPEYKQLIHLYQSCPKNKNILRESFSALIALYNTTVPQLVLEQKFDVSGKITKSLDQILEAGDRCDTFILQELEHLLTIGDCAIEAKWWQKPESGKITTTTTMLKLLATTRLGRNSKLSNLVKGILEDNFVLSRSDDVDALGILIKSLSVMHEKVNPDTDEVLYVHLDECLLRLVRKPIKYHADIDGRNVSVGAPWSPLITVLLEQWPFFVKSKDVSEVKAHSDWICVFIETAAQTGQPTRQLGAVLQDFLNNTAEKKVKKRFAECLSVLRTQNHETLSKHGNSPERHEHEAFHAKQAEVQRTMDELDTTLSIPKEKEDYPELTRWRNKDVLEAIIDSDILNLIYCLRSSYPEIRLQANTALQAFMTKVQSSTYDERQSIYLLLGILKETINKQGSEVLLPSIAISLAARSISVLNNPLHFMYTKVNHFLSKAPVWDLAKLPSYWMDRIFHKPPTNLEAHWKEVDWLLDLLLDGLQNESDVNLYRRTGVFERIIVNTTSTFAPRTSFEKMIHVLYRCALVGGSTTLITRFGILAWTASQKALTTKNAVLLTALEKRIRANCDAERVLEWSGGQIRCGIENSSENTEPDSYQLLETQLTRQDTNGSKVNGHGTFPIRTQAVANIV